MLASIQEALLRVKWNNEPKVQCLMPSEGSVNACTSCFSNLVQRGSQAWHQKFTDSFGLAWPSNRSTDMPWETLCKDMVCWLFFEGKMKYEYGNTRPTLQKKKKDFDHALSSPVALFLLLLGPTIFTASQTWGRGLAWDSCYLDLWS